MKTIHKFLLELTDWQEIAMPVGAEILTLQTQSEIPCIWALCDTTKPVVSRHFATRGTGHPLPDNCIDYIGTYQLQGGRMVFHVMEVL
jgi:hypothetical protein